MESLQQCVYVKTSDSSYDCCVFRKHLPQNIPKSSSNSVAPVLRKDLEGLAVVRVWKIEVFRLECPQRSDFSC